MSKYKYLVVTDLDSTLLNDAGEITPRTREYIETLRRRGDVLFTFSTGRPYSDCIGIYEDLKMDCYISCTNGSAIYYPQKKQARYNFLDGDLIITCLENREFLENFLDGSVNSDKKRFEYVEKDFGEVKAFLRSGEAGVFCCRFQFHLGADQGETDRRLDEKLIFLKSLPYDHSITAYKYPDCISVEIIAKISSKDASAQFLSSFYGVPMENVLTFGDQINDLSVAQGNTRFVAMSNSVDIVKLYAKVVSRYSNNEDGVVRELEEFFRDR